MGHPVIMGRKTYESIEKPYRPLKGRTNIVVTRQPVFEAPGCVVAHSLEEALKLAAQVDPGQAYVIGGDSIYREALPLSQEIIMTLVDGIFDGDVFFPELDSGEWREMRRESHEPDEKNPHRYSFVFYERVRR